MTNSLDAVGMESTFHDPRLTFSITCVLHVVLNGTKEDADGWLPSSDAPVATAGTREDLCKSMTETWKLLCKLHFRMSVFKDINLDRRNRWMLSRPTNAVPNPLFSKMHFSRILSFITTLAIATAFPLSAPLNQRNAVADLATTACPDPCAGTNYTQSLIDTYYCGDIRLWPPDLPKEGTVGDLIETYVRFGGLCAGEFLKRWTDPTNPKHWAYPGFDGFQLDINKKPIEGVVCLEKGFLVDRFGADTGSYLSPHGAPFVERSLPPSGLNTLDKE
jgi:Tuberculosis necrotizing toxin